MVNPGQQPTLSGGHNCEPRHRWASVPAPSNSHRLLTPYPVSSLVPANFACPVIYTDSLYTVQMFSKGSTLLFTLFLATGVLTRIQCYFALHSDRRSLCWPCTSLDTGPGVGYPQVHPPLLRARPLGHWSEYIWLAHPGCSSDPLKYSNNAPEFTEHLLSTSTESKAKDCLT